MVHEALYSRGGGDKRQLYQVWIDAILSKDNELNVLLYIQNSRSNAATTATMARTYYNHKKQWTQRPQPRSVWTWWAGMIYGRRSAERDDAQELSFVFFIVTTDDE
jgi:hypothetical protein